MDSKYISTETDGVSSTKCPSDSPDVVVRVREVTSIESSDETYIPTTPKISGGPLFESRSSIRQDEHDSDWVWLPALLSSFKDLEDRKQIFESFRYMITADIDAAIAAKRDAIARMELVERAREMAEESLVDMLELVMPLEKELRTQDALILVFEAILHVLNTKLELMELQLVDVEPVDDDFSHLEMGIPQEPVEKTSKDTAEQEGIKAEESMHGCIVSLNRISQATSDIRLQIDEERLEKQVQAGHNHFSEGSELTSIDRTYQSQTEVSTAPTDNEYDSFDDELVKICTAKPIDDALQHMLGRADNPENSMEKTYHDLENEIPESLARDIINQAVSDAAQSLLALANARDGGHENNTDDADVLQAQGHHDQNSPQNTSSFEGDTDIPEKVFDPDETVEENAPEEEVMNVPLQGEVTEILAEPMATLPGADDTVAETFNLPSRHTNCGQTCQVFASFLLTMKELYISPRAFCELLAGNIPMLETISNDANDTSIATKANIDKSTSSNCLLEEDIEEATRLRIDAFTGSLENLRQKVEANSDQDPEGSGTSSDHHSATVSFMSGITSLIEYGNLVLHKTDNVRLQERDELGEHNSKMSQDIKNLTEETSGKKKKKNKKKKLRGIDGLNIVPGSAVPTYKIRLQPAVKYEVIAQSSRNLFRETLERIKLQRMPVMPGAEGEIPTAAVIIAATVAELVIEDLDQSPEAEENLANESFGDLWERYVLTTTSASVQKKISEGILRAHYSGVCATQRLETLGVQLKAGTQLLEAILKVLRPATLPSPGRAVLLKSSEGIDRYARELADEIEDKLCLATTHLMFTGENWKAIAGECQSTEILFAKDMEDVPALFESAKNLPLKELEELQQKLVVEMEYDTEIRAFRGDSTRPEKIRAIALVRAMDAKLYGKSETEYSKVTEVFTTFDSESHLRKTCPGEDWTCVMLRQEPLSETFRVIRKYDAHIAQISCLLKYAPPVTLFGPDAPSPRLRQDNEVVAWELCGNFPPDEPNYLEPIVAVPRLLRRYPEDHILMINDMGNLTSLDHAFLQICPPNRQLISEIHAHMRFSEIGSRLGAWLAILHVPTSQNLAFQNFDSFRKSKIKELTRNYKYAAVGGILEKFKVPDSRELGQRIMKDFDFDFPEDFEVFAIGNLPLSAVLVQMPLVAQGRIAVMDWQFSGPGRGINGDMAQLLAGVHQFMFQMKGTNYKVPWRAMDAFIEAILTNYVEKSRGRGSTLVMKRGQSPKGYGRGKRRLPPKIATVLRSTFISYGAELILMAGLPGYKCKDPCCVEGVGECQRQKGLLQRGTWFLRMAGKNENDFQDNKWNEICKFKVESVRGILGLVFDYDALF